MDSFGIGISGLNAAQRAFDIIGNNIANAATDGYHRQRLNLTPAYMSQVGSIILGGGVDVAGVTRLIDGFLQKEVFRQQSSLEQVSQELGMLRMVRDAFHISGKIVFDAHGRIVTITLNQAHDLASPFISALGSFLARDGTVANLGQI